MNFSPIIVLLVFLCLSCDTKPPVPSLDYNELTPLLQQKGDMVYVVNFWSTWCAPCVKELPYFEALNQQQDVEILLVSLDFPKHKASRLIPFLIENDRKSKVLLLDDEDENTWINAIDPSWSGALPATLIYTQQKRGFYEQSFSQNELQQLISSFKP